MSPCRNVFRAFRQGTQQTAVILVVLTLLHLITIDHIMKGYMYIYCTKKNYFEKVCEHSIFPHARSYHIGNHSFLIFAQCATKSAMHNYSDILYRNLIMNMGGDSWLQSTTFSLF